MTTKNRVIRSIVYGAVLFMVLSIIDLVIQSDIKWEHRLFGVIIGTLLFYGFLWQDKKAEDERRR